MKNRDRRPRLSDSIYVCSFNLWELIISFLEDTSLLKITFECRIYGVTGRSYSRTTLN